MWLYAKPILDKLARVVFSARFWSALGSVLAIWFLVPEEDLSPYIDAVATLIAGIFLILGYSIKSPREITGPTEEQLRDKYFIEFIKNKYGDRP